MITIQQFDIRIKALWQSQQKMAEAKKWKTGRLAGKIRVPASPIHFTHDGLRTWLWTKVGLNTMRCRYCGAAIDILTLTLDHIIPRRAKGPFTLANLQPICKDDNARKGDMSHEGFESLLGHVQTELSEYDRDILMNRLKDASAGSPARFFRDKKEDQQQPFPTAGLEKAIGEAMRIAGYDRAGSNSDRFWLHIRQFLAAAAAEMPSKPKPAEQKSLELHGLGEF